MTDSKQGKISFRRAIYLALTVLCIYYPITIAANIPFEHWTNVQIFALPAIVHFVFYALLIIGIDRIIDGAEKLVGPGILELRIGTIALSIVVAALAVVLSQLLFKLNYKIWHMLAEPASQMHTRKPGTGPPPLWQALGRANYALTLVTSISIFYLILNRKSHFRMRNMEIQAEQLMKENALAQFEALKNQVSPHFLFNSLSILSSLVHVDANLSEKFIDRLSRAYRYILEQKDNDTVDLKTELDFLESYAFLLKIRFENKFDVKITITEQEAEKYQIAPLTLQLLIENCVKHNRMSEKDPLIVTILIKNDYLVVSNPIRPRSELERVTSTKIGLANIKNRYRLLTERPVQIQQEDELFTVKIPLI
ncbi:MAG TPA: histidine kinase [Cyclobacteriaceae bacterium]|nr:histidine kinase [Cyclobacteriaceae bacterium]